MSTQDLRDRVKKKLQQSASNRKDVPPKKETKSVEIEPERDVYFETSRSKFWVRGKDGEWREYNEAFVTRSLASSGVSPRRDSDQYLSQADKVLYRVQTEQTIDWAGQLAGYTKGVHTVCGQKILVTSSPKLIVAERGKFDTLRSYLSQLLGDQMVYFCGWMKSAIESLRGGPPFRPGQMLAIAGPAGCGKSLLQSIITELLGGRSAKPYRYLSGATAFNKDLVRAEHLMIEDEASSTDLRTRKTVGQMLKNMIVNETQSLHCKGKDALMVTPFWRLTITLNREPENLMVLPPLEVSLRDKIILLLATPVKFPFEGNGPDARAKFRQTISSELPAFVNYLNVFKIREGLEDSRYGIAAWHHPELVQELDELSPEFRLLGLIDSIGIWSPGEPVWIGGANDLERLLRQKDGTGDVARLLTFNTACGMYLSRLKTRYPSRIEEKTLRSRQRAWSIRMV